LNIKQNTYVISYGMDNKKVYKGHFLNKQ